MEINISFIGQDFSLTSPQLGACTAGLTNEAECKPPEEEMRKDANTLILSVILNYLMTKRF